MKIGLLYCAFNTAEYIDDSLASWIRRPDVVISCVSTPFLEYKGTEIKRDKTQEKLKDYQSKGLIKYLVTEPEFLPEHEARNLALKPLLKEDVDWVWLADSDEFPTKQEVERTIKFIDNTPFITWFSTHYKNIVFDGKSYVDDFCPPRIFKVDNGNYTLKSLIWDNDFSYYGKITRDIKPYKGFATMKVPKGCFFAKHLTWLNNERSKSKSEYQKKHFGHCSYTWDEKENKLIFDEEFFKKTGQTKPDLIPLEEEKPNQNLFNRNKEPIVI